MLDVDDIYCLVWKMQLNVGKCGMQDNGVDETELESERLNWDLET